MVSTRISPLDTHIQRIRICVYKYLIDRASAKKKDAWNLEYILRWNSVFHGMNRTIIATCVCVDD